MVNPDTTHAARVYAREAFELAYCLTFAVFAWGGLGVFSCTVILAAFYALGGVFPPLIVWGIIALGVAMMAIGTALAFGAQRLEIGTELEGFDAE